MVNFFRFACQNCELNEDFFPPLFSTTRLQCSVSSRQLHTRLFLSTKYVNCSCNWGVAGVHTHTHAHSRNHAHSRTNTLNHTHVHSRALTHNHAQSRTLTHTHTYSRTLTRAQSLQGAESSLTR